MSAEFYARVANKTYGPFDSAKLKKLALAGRISRDDAISKDGKTGWTLAGNVKGLFPPAELLPAVTERPHPIETVIPREPIAIARAAPVVQPEVYAPVAQPQVVVVQAPQQPQQQIVQQTTVVVNPHLGNTAGMIAAVLALIALVFCWIPLVGLLVIPLALLALLFAAIGLFVALFRRGSGLIASLGGGTVALIAIAVSLLSTGAAVTTAIGATDKAIQAAAKSQAAAQASDGSAAGMVAESGSIKVTVTSARIERVLVGDGENYAPAEEPALAVRMRVENTSTDRKIDYRSWGRTDLEWDAPTAVDDLGNEYRTIDLHGLRWFKDQVNGLHSIYPGKSLDEMLVFEAPLPQAKQISIKLDGGNTGQEGEAIQLAIPASEITHEP